LRFEQPFVALRGNRHASSLSELSISAIELSATVLTDEAQVNNEVGF